MLHHVLGWACFCLGLALLSSNVHAGFDWVDLTSFIPKNGTPEYYVDLSTHLGNPVCTKVFRGCDAKQTKVVAIKCAPTEDSRNIIQQEIEFYKSIPHHESIPTMHASYGDKFVLDLLGPTLRKLVDRMCDKKFSVNTVALIGQAVLSVLDHLDRNNYMHGDLHCGNVMVSCDEAKIIVADYGCSLVRRENKIVGPNSKLDVSELGLMLEILLGLYVSTLGGNAKSIQHNLPDLSEPYVAASEGEKLMLEYYTKVEKLNFEYYDATNYTELSHIFKEYIIVGQRFDWLLPVEQGKFCWFL